MSKEDGLPKKEVSQETSSIYETIILRNKKNGEVILIYTDEACTQLIVETILFEWNNGEPSMSSSIVRFNQHTANIFTDMLIDTLPCLKK